MKIKDFKKNVIKKKISKVLEVDVVKSHHVIYKIFYKGKFVLRTFHSHRRGDLKEFEIRAIKNQLRLDNKNQLNDLNECPLGAKDYLEILKVKSII